MKTAAALHVGSKSHPGLHRTVNEDRILIEESYGIFLVADGLGGHAAGETAAEIAAQAIREWLLHPNATGDLQDRIKAAITEANNRIFELAQSRQEWTGMACVLTLAVVQDEKVAIGHVGDSRLYLVSKGLLHKVTSDHSPVGEWEESGALTEAEAMQHPRRHEVFRDVGSERRQPDDPEFIQLRQISFPPDAALLLCTDGLSDAITVTEIRQIISGYRGNCEEIAGRLIEAANQAGGKDNVSVIFIAGPEFTADSQERPVMLPASDRHTITRIRGDGSRIGKVLEKLPWLLAGMLLGIFIWAVAERLVPSTPTSPHSSPGTRSPVHIAVNPMDPRGIISALAGALPGDTVEISPGDYLGPLVLKNGVNLVGSWSVHPVIRTDPAASANLGIAVLVSGIQSGKIENLEIVSDATHPLRIGISIENATVHVVNNKISGAIEAGIRVAGKSDAALFANNLTGNFGAGVQAQDESSLHLSGNWFTNNGKVPGALRGGLAMAPGVHCNAGNNFFLNNGLGNK